MLSPSTPEAASFPELDSKNESDAFGSDEEDVEDVAVVLVPVDGGGALRSIRLMAVYTVSMSSRPRRLKRLRCCLLMRISDGGNDDDFTVAGGACAAVLAADVDVDTAATMPPPPSRG